jgi:hypothetical protein
MNSRVHAGLCGLSDPFDPDRSLNLNRRYWPNAAFFGLDLLREAEDLFRHGDEVRCKKALLALGPPICEAGHIDAILWRARRLAVGKSAFGHAKGSLDVSHADPRLWENIHDDPNDDSVHAVRLNGRVTRTFDPMLRTLRALHQIHFGAGTRQMVVMTRYAHSVQSSEIQASANPAADFHFDGYGDFNAVCYLQTVCEDDGPFEYIEGSETLHQSLLLRAVHEHLFFDLGLTQPQQLESWPLALRGTPRVGDFLDPEKAQTLLAYRREMLGGPGLYIIFDARYLIHRGGMPRKGRRLAVFANPVLPYREAQERLTVPKLVRPIWWS